MRLLSSEVRRLSSRRLVFWLLLVSLVLVVLLNVLVAGYADKMQPWQLWLTKGAADALGVKRENVITTVSVLTYLLVIVIGASAVGAEYRAGTVTTILTWEPRRVRLLTARLAAAAIVGMAFFLVVHLLLVGGWMVGAALRGTTAGTDSDFWRELVSVIVRATVLAGVLAAVSGALASIGKNTAAAMGIWFGYLIAIEAILRGQLSAAVPWFLIPNAAAFYGWEAIRSDGHSVAAGAGALRLLLYLVVVGVVALGVFQRRDVT
jgi:ABC-type transport system involved in multi-copper enzyme maturation permease subunit